MVSLLTDDFEDCSNADWVIGNTAEFLCVSTDNPHGGTYHGRHRRTGGGGDPESYKSFTRQTGGIVIVECWGKWSSASSNHSIHVLDSINGGYFNVYFRVSSGNKLQYYDGAWHDIQTVNLNQYYKIGLVCRPSVPNFDIWVDNVEKVTQASPYGTVTGIDRFRIGSWSTGNYYLFIDDINVYTLVKSSGSIIPLMERMDLI